MQTYSTTTIQDFIYPQQKVQVRLVCTRVSLHPEVDRKLKKYCFKLYKSIKNELIANPVKPSSHYEIAGRAQKELNDYLEAIRLNQTAKAQVELNDLIKTLGLLESQSDHLYNVA